MAELAAAVAGGGSVGVGYGGKSVTQKRNADQAGQQRGVGVRSAV